MCVWSASVGPIKLVECSSCHAFYIPTKDNTLCHLCFLHKLNTPVYEDPTPPEEPGAKKEKGSGKKKKGSGKVNRGSQVVCACAWGGWGDGILGGIHIVRLRVQPTSGGTLPDHDGSGCLGVCFTSPRHPSARRAAVVPSSLTRSPNLRVSSRWGSRRRDQKKAARRRAKRRSELST